MVRSIHKINILYFSLATILLACSPALPVSAAEVDLEVNITEILSVSVTTNDTWATGGVDATNGSNLLRYKATLNVASNNASGFTASMASKTTTNLLNQTNNTTTIPTLAAATTAASFPVNAWGYSTDDTDAGLTTANYSAMQTSAIALAGSDAPATLSQDVFFGARADTSKESGTYANTVVFTVVSGVITDEEQTPPTTDPVTPSPSDPSTGDQIASNNGTNRYEYNYETGELELVDTNVSAGNVSNTYADPQGVTTTNVGSGTPLATGLAVTAGVAATSGLLFFIIAKKKKDEEEEEEF